ncbi:MAG: phosphoenolpyruvate kinase [Myxococcaceae bacterium]
MLPQPFEGLAERLARAEQSFRADFPSDDVRRQPVHVVYGGAHLFKPDTAKKLGTLALQALETWAPDAPSFAKALDLGEALAEQVRPRVVKKLQTEPVEDLRIDFEDGYGARADAEEDGHALAAGRAWSQAREKGLLPAFSGLRIKALTTELAPRALRTLRLFLSGVGDARALLVTLPKVVTVEQALVLLDALDSLGAKDTRIELMIEAPQALALLEPLRRACGHRLHAVHLGLYDLTAALDVSAADQTFQHPVCDHARTQLKLAFSGTRVFMSDGATTQFPVPVHRGEKLSEAQQRENRAAVHAAWRASAADIRHSLRFGLYQGWDLHPAQLVARYGTVTAFYVQNLPAMSARLQNFTAQLGQATLSGTSFDDAATGQGLLNFFLRGLGCGALDASDVQATGLTAAELATRSFAKIAAARRGV